MNEVENILGDGSAVVILPNVVCCDTWNTFKIKLKVPRKGLLKGESIGFVSGSNIDRWNFSFASHIWGTYKPWQVDDPAAPGYTTATCSRNNVEIDLKVGSFSGIKPFCNLPDHFVRSLKKRDRYILEIRPLADLYYGDEIVINWGDMAWGSVGVRAPSVAMNYYFLPFCFSNLPEKDGELSIRRGLYKSLPSVRIQGKEAVKIHLAAQPLLGKGESFSLHLAAVDEYGNLAEDFKGKVFLACTDRGAKIPSYIILGARDKGRKKVRNIRLMKTGWNRISAMHRDVSGKSNQILVNKEKPKDRIYFGEMHGHTLDCDGLLTADEHFIYARDVAGFDFAALGAHAEYFGTIDAWIRYLDVTSRFNRSQDFVTFYGYEWAGEGHINAYFTREAEAMNIYGKNLLRGRHEKDKPMFSISATKAKRFMKLLKSLECQKLAITHCHVKCLDEIDDEVVRLHEIYSSHQANPKDELLQEMLAKGLRVGVVAGSDSHRFPLGSLCSDPEPIWPQSLVIEGHRGTSELKKKGGLQATFVKRLDRPSLWSSMQNRYTYGTTGARIVLFFEVDSARMGQETTINPENFPLLHARIGGTDKIKEVRIYKYDGHKETVA